MNKKVLFSSKTDDWATPQELFNKLNEEYNFTLDPCASKTNHKCEKYYTKEQDGLKQEWNNEIVYCNPPYGKEIYWWIEKAYKETTEGSAKIVVMLLPARTDTRWFHNFIYKSAEIRFIKGRLKFGKAKNSAPFPSMVVIFKKNNKNENMGSTNNRM